jgi:hypothetical protein
LYRSPGNGWRIRGDVEWDMLRIPPHQTFLCDYYKPNYINNLKPGDYVEVQKRRRKEYPYGNKQILNVSYLIIKI